MAGQRRYSDILAEILQRKHSKCTCPPDYFHTSTKPKKDKEECQFGSDCQFIGTCGVKEQVMCQYNQAKCTCSPQCICGPQPQAPVQLLEGPELNQVIDAQICICGANCYCESEGTLLPSNFYRSPSCDKTKCICNVCLCQPDVSDPRLLPTNFRNAVKREPMMTTDERLKQECAEIKQLLIEHEESKKKEKELEESTNQAATDKCSKKNVLQKEVTAAKDNAPPSSPSENKDDVKDLDDKTSKPQEGRKSPENLKSVLKESELPETVKTNKKSPKKEKTPKRKVRPISVVKQKMTAPSEFTQYSCGCRIPKKKPPHIRFYFSGSTEHYGVKLGHNKCLPKPTSVPKNMGWLWNIEDPSRGIRERKGWPPGFIAKNIKNMIKVLKQFDDPVEPGTKAPSHTESGRRFVSRWREQDEEGAEPQEDPPLLHIHKKGRTYNITFCPKSSDKDIGPIPIPFSITEKHRDSDSDSTDSTLEFEFHSPKPRLKTNKPVLKPEPEPSIQEDKVPEETIETTAPSVVPPSVKPGKKKPNKRSSKSTEENKNLWEEQQTQIQNIA